MMAVCRTPGVGGLSLSSLILAALSFSSRWTVLPLTPTTFIFVDVSVAFCFAWLVLIIVSITRYGKRSLWLLVGGPFVMWWPAVFVLLLWSCKNGYECL